MSEKKESPPSAAPLRAADFFVDSLPGLLPSKMEQLSMHSGMIMVNETIQGQLFFWLVEAQIPQPQRKLLIWFNGWPRMLFLDGLFLENGPLRLRPPSASEKSTVDNFIDLNPHSWHHASSILYVDQPVGTGYSPVLSYRWNTDLRSVVDQFVVFLDKFLDTFPHLKKAEIYLGGESFGGVYVPYFSSALIFRNEDPKTDKNRVYNVAGGIIESGWMDPLRQYSSYIDYSVKNKLLGSPQLSYAQSNLDKCAVSLRHEGTERIRTQVCERIMDIILDYSKTDGKQCVNMYDIRLRDSDQREGCGLNTWPPGVRSLRDYLSREDVQRALHAEAPTHSARQNIGWEECNQVVFDSLMLDKSLPSYTLLPFLLERIPIVLYGGEKGLVCNTLGIDWMISNMTWNKAKGMQDATLMNWVVNGSSVGTYQTARNLTNIVTYDASHSPNVDQPLYTLEFSIDF
ncbi:Alpha/Beta hydrolase protein [Chytridium lagenaria]|nr:Alpha/Beta hydrolase protein [Chytridium lagenaria]